RDVFPDRRYNDLAALSVLERPKLLVASARYRASVARGEARPPAARRGALIVHTWIAPSHRGSERYRAEISPIAGFVFEGPAETRSRFFSHDEVRRLSEWPSYFLLKTGSEPRPG